MEENKDIKSYILPKVVMCLLPMAAIFLLSYFFGFEKAVIIKNLIVVGILVIVMMFTIESELVREHFAYNNSEQFLRFFFAYLIFLLAACLFPFIPEAGWAFLSIFVTLSLFSSAFCGYIASILLLTISVLLTPSCDINTFICFLIPGLVGVVMFNGIGDEFKVGRPMLISLLFQFLCLAIKNTLLVNNTFSIGMFFVPVINILVCIAVMLFVLKIFSFSLLYKTKDRYMDIIDPEFELLVSLKNTSREEYDHAIYTAVLCSKLACAMCLDETVTKALGYYHHIGVLKGDNSWPAVEEILVVHDIPIRVRELLREYLDPGTPLKSREIVALMFADTMVSSIKYLFVKDKEAVIDYDKLIDAVFEKKLQNKAILDSKITYEDMNTMRRVFSNEKLFYDFLR